MKDAAVVEERVKMQEYWKAYSDQKTYEAMMLDKNAALLHKEEQSQVVNMLPNLKGKDILELAAGVGRYTEVLLKQNPSSYIAVDFISQFINENRLKNEKNCNNIQFICEDVANLELKKDEKKDLVFSNWLLMYLSDEEVPSLLLNTLKWLKVGGIAFFRESCFRQSGDLKRGENPTHYRHPRFYIGHCRSISYKEEDGSISYFELVSSCSVDAYRKLKNNHGQICFLWKKCILKKEKKEENNEKDDTNSFQTFLDEQQYSEKSIKRYEKIFGSGYISTGGQETTTEFVSKLNLKEGSKVLDVGCGIGGGDFYMAKEFKASVQGIDLSTNMVHFALENAMKSYSTLDVSFEVCDATKKEFPKESFDVIYSRDTLLHILDKKSLFKKFLMWLKPGGKLLISDYCCGEQEPSDHFKDYVLHRGYHLLSPNNYGKLIKEVGFHDVIAEDRTEQFSKILREELERTLSSRDVFINETSLDDYEDIINGWKAKLERCAQGDQKWGLFIASKEQ